MSIFATHPEWVQSLFSNGGWYVEAGAHDGIGDSNTYSLELTGKWQGLCIEPSSYFNGLRQSRKCYVCPALLGDGDNHQFREIKNGELSGITGCFYDSWDRSNGVDTIIKTIALPNLLDAFRFPTRPEYLSLDVEGAELMILRTLILSPYRFKALSVEHNGVPTRKSSIEHILISNGYQLSLSGEIDDRYILKI